MTTQITKIVPVLPGWYAILWNTTPDRNGKHWSKEPIVALALIQREHEYGTIEYVHGIIADRDEFTPASHYKQFLCYTTEAELHDPEHAQWLEKQAIQRVKEAEMDSKTE